MKRKRRTNRALLVARLVVLTTPAALCAAALARPSTGADVTITGTTGIVILGFLFITYAAGGLHWWRRK
jgi:hypothetical protein